MVWIESKDGKTHLYERSSLNQESICKGYDLQPDKWSTPSPMGEIFEGQEIGPTGKNCCVWCNERHYGTSLNEE